jgi:capsular exopolysaccharide synthesis family protein
MKSTEHPDIDFHQLWLALQRRWFPGVSIFVITVGLAIPVALMQKPSYEARGKLLFKPNRTPALTGVGNNTGELAPLTQTGNPVSTEIEIIRSIPLVKETITALNLRDSEGNLIKPEILQKQIKVKLVGATDVVELSYTTTNPQEAAGVINQLMNFYRKNNVSTNRAEIIAAQKFIKEQLPTAEANVNQAEAAMREFKEKYQVIALEEEAKSAVEVIANLEQQITQIQSELKESTTRSLELQKKVDLNSQEAIDRNSVNQSTGVQTILQELQKVQAELSVQQTRFLDANPVIANLKEKETALKALLQEQITQTIGHQQNVPIGQLQIGEFKEQLTADFVKSEVERMAIASRLDLLINAQSAYKQRLSILPKLEKEQRELQRRLEATQATYQTLLQKLQEVRVAENQNIGNARIVEAAQVPDKKSRSKSIMIVFLGGIAGTLLSLATLITLEVRDTSIKTLPQIRTLFGYTLLGTIPQFTKKTPSKAQEQERIIPELSVRQNPNTPLSEAYRMLHANLKFLSSDRPPKVIVVTSSVPQEGKSTVSANLAVAIAQLGRKVLLMDADLRHPLQHHIWKLTNSVGLSDVLVNQVEFESAISEVIDNLNVLSSGVIPPNPLALLDSKRMALLIENCAKHYDFVIIDAPPLVIAVDALTLGKMADGLLLIARPGVVNSTQANTSKELLERSNQNVLGLVVNGIIVENEKDSYFYYGKGNYLEQHPPSKTIINPGKIYPS